MIHSGICNKYCPVCTEIILMQKALCVPHDAFALNPWLIPAGSCLYCLLLVDTVPVILFRVLYIMEAPANLQLNIKLFYSEVSNSYVQGDYSVWLKQTLVCQKPVFGSLSSVWYAVAAVLMWHWVWLCFMAEYLYISVCKKIIPEANQAGSYLYDEFVLVLKFER